MISKTVTSQQIDNIDKAVDELLEALFRDFSLMKNSCGFLFCDSDMDQAELIEKLCAGLDFSVVGCTSIATLDNVDGMSSMTITLLVISDDKCEFNAVVSAPITAENIQSVINDTWKSASARFSELPKLIFTLPPYILDIMLDEYTNIFNDIAPGIPVIGGLPSFQGVGDTLCSLFDGRTYTDRMVFVAIYGDIRPIVRVANVIGNVMEKKLTVTSSKNNIVYRVGDQTFVDYMRDMGFDFSRLSKGINVPFFSSPMLIEQTDKESGDNYSLVRAIHELNMEDGSCVSIGLVPEGARLSLTSLSREDIEKTVFDASQYISEEIQKEEARDSSYRYSTVLAVSCIARYFLMMPNHLDTEADQILTALPSGLSLAGFYSYGEIGPLRTDGSLRKNFAHTQSLVLCAF